MSKRTFWDQSRVHEAEHARRVKAAADAYPHKSLAEAMEFTENLRDVAIRGFNEANKMENKDFAIYERAFWQGVDQACTAIRRATTISR